MYKGVFLIHYVFHKRFSDTVLIRDETYVTNHRHIIERILRYGGWYIIRILCNPRL